jgi:hypothetical protein
MASLVVSKIESRITLFFSILVLLGAFWLNLPAVPYKGVKVISIDRTAQWIDFFAAFQKTECRFAALEVIAGAFGETEFLAWRDLDGLPPDYDRAAGLQTLRIAFDFGRLSPDWIEIRTQHDCGGKKVDKVFYRIEPVAHFLDPAEGRNF